MGQIIGYIISCIIASIISFVGLGGIVLGVLVEMKGLGSQLAALTIVIASIVELSIFLGEVFLGSNISIKDLFENIKSHFSKKKLKENKKANEDHKKIKFLYIVELVILLAIVVYSIIVPTHSRIANVIYNGFFIKAFSNLLIPLFIMITINAFVDNILGFFSSIFSSIGTLLISLMLGLTVSSAMIFVASVWYPDIETSIKKNWFIYDNANFDSIRGKDFDTTAFLKTEIKKIVDYAFENADCDYSDEVCMKRIKTNMINSNLYSKNISIRNYGYVVAQNIEIDVYNEALSIRDLKDTHLIYYKISYKEFSFDEISEDEYNNIAKSKNS